MLHIIQQLKTVAASLVLASGLAFVGVTSLTTTVHAEAKEAVCAGVNQGGGTCESDGEPINKVLATTINILSLIAGIAAVIFLIISGLRYITSNGDSSSIASAKNGIIYAIIGLIVVALSQVVVKFVLSRASSGGQ